MVEIDADELAELRRKAGEHDRLCVVLAWQRTTFITSHEAAQATGFSTRELAQFLSTALATGLALVEKA